MKRTIFGVIFIALALFAGSYAWSSSREPKDVVVDIPDGLTRMEVAAKIGEAVGWGEKEKENFAAIHAQIQWAAWNRELIDIFTDEYKWSEEEKEAFATQSARYFNEEHDFLSKVYVAGTYVFKEDMSAAQMADVLTNRVKEIALSTGSGQAGEDLRGFLEERLWEEKMDKVAELVRQETELLPDIVPLPARDMDLIRADGKVYLRFTTMYYNQGKGPLELVADPATKEIRGVDIERKVFQRVYRSGEKYRDKFVGVFYWHQPHLHYHFKDFVTYDLEGVDVKDAPDLSGVLTKSTFCVRDVSRTDLDLEYRDEKARYLICGRNLQGISVGWADTYFFDYPDQRLNVTDLPTGMYKLTFTANPDGVFDELNKDNNRASVTFKLDTKDMKITVLSEDPERQPKVEHVYIKQVFD